MVLLLLALAALMVAGAKETVKRAIAYVKGVPVSIELAPIGDGKELRKDAAAAFLRMKAAAKADGLDLPVNSAFRTMEQQEYLYQLFLTGDGNTAAKPGYSNHQNGIAVDIEVGGSFTSVRYRWLAANAAAYGFTNDEGKRINEPWHWVYVI